MQTSMEPIRRPLERLGTLSPDQTRSRAARRRALQLQRCRAAKQRMHVSLIAQRYPAQVAA